jgi:hypothetical protein
MLFIDRSEIQRGEIFVGLSHRADQLRLLFEQCSIIIHIGEEVLQNTSSSFSSMSVTHSMLFERLIETFNRDLQ